MKRSELNDEARERLDEIVEKWVKEIENLGKGEEWGLDKNLKKLSKDQGFTRNPRFFFCVK